VKKFGAFEALFALACLYFGNGTATSWCFEARIGGRYDPVRLVGALVTSSPLWIIEHVELLGQTLELIVSDKSDALRLRRHHRLWRKLSKLAGASDGI